MVAYTLDLTGLSQANRVLNEIRDVSKEGHRIFVPAAGAFYTRQFEIRNSSNGQLLTPGTQYILLNMDRKATIQSGLNVCAVVYIRDMSVTSVTMTYQCVGGMYQNTQAVIEDRLKDYLDGTTPADVVGSLARVPVQLPPQAHLHIGEKTVYGFNDMVTMLDNIRQAIITGDDGMIALIFQHIDMVVADAERRMTSRVNEATERVNQLNTQTEIGIGRFIFTDNPDNPNTYLGYGEWILNPNVFLYGANLDETPGDLVYIDSGDGHLGRKTYIWQRVKSTGSISYNITSSASTANEGDTLTFTLNTTGLTPGTVIPYTISGVSSADIAGGLLTGKFNIGAGGVAITRVRILEDNLTEGQETLRIRLTNMPSVETSVNIRDTSLSPSISLRFSANSNGTGTITTANEGQVIYLVINATNVPVGSIYNLHYNNSTVNDADFVGVRPATVTIDTATTIIPYTVKADYVTETSEILAVAVSKGTYAENIAATTLTVVDSSKNTTWTVRFSSNTTGTDTITTVDEGQTIYAIVEGKFVPSSFNGQLIYSGIDTSANGDLVNPSFPTFAVEAGDSVTYRATIALRADTLTEGTEVLTATFRNSATNATLASGTIVVQDTSTSPTFQLKFTSNTSGTDTVTSINEGAVAYAYLRTTNIPNGTTLQVQWGGTATDADFTSTRATSATVQNGIATVALSVKADTLTEGQETVTIAFLSAGTTVATGSIILNDTSVTPVYNLRYSSNSSGTGTITATNEGATVYLVVETKNVANNTKLYLTYASVTGTVNNDDFVGTRITEVTVVNNQAIVPMTLRNDLTTEGSESMRTSLMTGSVSGPVVDTTDLQINDTSVPSFNIYFSTNANGTGSVTGVNEGTTVYCVVETQGVADGTSLAMSYSLTNADFDGGVPPAVVIQANKGFAVFTLREDFLTEGNETLVVTALRSNVTVATGTLVINDTSRNQEFNGRWSTSSTGSGTVTQANEGATVYYVVETLNVPNGTVLPFRMMSGATVVPSSQFDTLPTTITVNNNLGIAAVKIKADVLYETNVTYEGVITHSTGSLVGRAALDVLDTSVPNTSVLFMSANMATVANGLEEGNNYVIAVDMRGAPKGTPYQLKFGGTAVLADFIVEGANLAPGTVYNRTSDTVVQYFPIAVKADLITEGNESIAVTLSVNGIDRASHQVTILDTSKNTTATIRFTGGESSNTAIANINEGATAWVVVTTTNVVDGTSFDLVWAGTIASTQWTPLPSTITITANRAAIAITARNDQAIDGTQTTTVTLVNKDTGTTLGQAQLQVMDTSTPSLSLHTTANTINEGGTFGLSAMMTGTLLQSAYVDFDILNKDGTRATADFVDALPKRITSTTNFQREFTFSFTAKMDKLTEGDETFTVVAKYNDIATSTASLTVLVKDTSVAEGYTAFFAASNTATATNKITTVNEGTVFYYIVETLNVANGTVLTIQYPTGVGLVDATDFDGARPTTLTINNNRGFISLSSKADGLLEGNEKLTVRGLSSAGVQLVSTDITVVDTSQPTIDVYLERNIQGTNYGLTVPMPQAYSTINDFGLHINYSSVAPGLKLHVKYWFDFDPSSSNYVLQGESTATYAELSAFMTSVGSYGTSITLPLLVGGSDRPQNNLHIRVYVDDWRSVTNPRLAKNGSHTGKLNYTYTDGWPYGHRVVLYKLSSVPNPNANQPWNEPQSYSVGDWTSHTTIEEGVPYGIWVISRGPWYDSATNHFRYIYDGKTYTAAELLATGQVESAPPATLAVSPQNGSNDYKWKRAGTITFRADTTTEGNKTLTVEVGPSATFPRSVTQALTVIDTSTTAGVEGVSGISLARPYWIFQTSAVLTQAMYQTYRRSGNVYLGQVVASKSATYAAEETARFNFIETENIHPSTSTIPTISMAAQWNDPWTVSSAPGTLAANIDRNIPFERLTWQLATPSYENCVWVTYRDRQDYSLAEPHKVTVDTITKPTNTVTSDYEVSRELWNGQDESIILVRLKTVNLPNGAIVKPIYSATDMTMHLSTKGTVAVVPALNMLPSSIIPTNTGPQANPAYGFAIYHHRTEATYNPTTTLSMSADESLNLRDYNRIYPTGWGDFCRVFNNQVIIPFYMSQVSNTTGSTAAPSVDSYKFKVNANGQDLPTVMQFDFVNYPQLYSTELGALRTGTTTNRDFYMAPGTVTEITIIGGGGGGGGSGYLGTSNIDNGTLGGTSVLSIEGSGIPLTGIAYAGGGLGGKHGRTLDSGLAAMTMGGFFGNWQGLLQGSNVPAVVAGRRMYTNKTTNHPNLYPVTVVYMRYTSRVTLGTATYSNHIVAYSQTGGWAPWLTPGQPATNENIHVATNDDWTSATSAGVTYKTRNVPGDFNINAANFGKGGAGGGYGVSEAYGGFGGGAGAIVRVAIINRGESPLKGSFIAGAAGTGGRAGGYATTVTTADTGYASRVGKDGTRGCMMITRISKISAYDLYFSPINAPILQEYTTTTYVTMTDLGVAPTSTETVNGVTYSVYRGVELREAFYNKFKRYPASKERVFLTVTHAHALVGNSTNDAGITISSAWPADAPIVIQNTGLILGLGGSSGDWITGRNNSGSLDNIVLPGPGIRNNSKAQALVMNLTNGKLEGGGGGGGNSLMDGNRGGGGAPYGRGGINIMDGKVTPNQLGSKPGGNATLLVGGNGGHYNSKNYGGNGGAPGAAGTSGRYGITDRYYTGQAPGARYIGIVYSN